MTIAARETTESEYRERILRVLVHIQRHLDSELDLESLAAVACFSPFHFHRIFKGMVGEGVTAHVRRLRLERAAHQLGYSDDQIVRIAFSAGYETHESFTRAFRALFGRSPSEFRKRRRDGEMRDDRVHYSADGSIVLVTRKGATGMDVKIESMGPVRVAFVRHVGPYGNVGTAWQSLMGWAGRRGMFMLGPVRMLGLTYDDPDVTPPEKLRYDACLVVGAEVDAEDEVGVQEIAGGEFATATHVGAYRRLGETYEALMGGWLPTSGRTLGEPPSIEEYLNNPQTTPEDQLRTKVWVRLA